MGIGGKNRMRSSYRYLAYLLRNTLSSLAIISLCLPPPALALDPQALPTGENVVAGAASFDRSTPNLLNVHQHSQRAVIDWSRFDIGSSATTEFFQPSASSIAVNRVTAGHDPTQIMGTLKSNGRLFILDPNGVIFGEQARVDVGGLVASTGSIDTASFMSGSNRILLQDAMNGSIVNRGRISVAEGGLAAFVAPHALNNGTITARLGRVNLAAGTKATVDLSGDGLVEIAVDGKTLDALVENTGNITADGGYIRMEAASARTVLDTAINMNGQLQANTVGVKQGKIVLTASGTGSRVNVSGDTKTDGGAGTGDAGEILIWSDGTTDFTGRVYARGGAIAGDGGMIEVSGDVLHFTGRGDTSAATGRMGTLLLDPAILNIGTTNPGGSGTFLLAQSLADSLEVSNITADATTSLNIVNNINLSKTSANVTTAGNLTLQAPTVNVNNSITMGTGNLIFSANVINLAAKMYDQNGTTLLGSSRLSGAANIANINSTAASIQQGIHVVNTNKTVFVKLGTYDENIDIYKDILLQGQSSGGSIPVLRGTTAGGTVATISAAGATFDRIKILSAISGGGNSAYGIHAQNVNDLTIKRSIIEDFSGTGHRGIFLDNSDNSLIHQNTFNNNQTAIYLEDSTGVDPLDNVITNTASGTGIELLRETEALVRGNTISGGAYGVKATDSTDLEVFWNETDESDIGYQFDNINTLWLEGNIAGGTTTYGINVFDSNDVLIDRSWIKDLNYKGIRSINNDNVTYTSNLFYTVDGSNNKVILKSSADGRAFFISGGSNHTLDGNQVDDWYEYGVYLDDVDGVTLSDNIIRNNDVGLYVVDSKNHNITLTDNIFEDNADVGAWFKAAKVAFSGANEFINGKVGIRFDSKNVSFQGGLTLASAEFSGQTDYYIELINNAFYNNNVSQTIDATGAVFDGIQAGPGLSNADLITIEGKIYDLDDASKRGQVKVK